jgi:hypothetical protein
MIQGTEMTSGTPDIVNRNDFRVKDIVNREDTRDAEYSEQEAYQGQSM